MTCSVTVSALVCACMLLSTTDRDVRPEVAQATCEAIEAQAAGHGFDPVTVAAIAWRESRFIASAVGTRGELGVLQVMPFYVTGKKGPFSRSDLKMVSGGVSAGLLVMERWRQRHPDKWQACYASGNACAGWNAVRQSRRYERTLRGYISLLTATRYTTKALQRAQRRSWNHGSEEEKQGKGQGERQEQGTVALRVLQGSKGKPDRSVGKSQ